MKSNQAKKYDPAFKARVALAEGGLPRPGEPARYYLECTLSKLHGVRFGPDDYIEDKAYARSPEVVELRGSFERLERWRIADAKLGLSTDLQSKLTAKFKLAAR